MRSSSKAMPPSTTGGTPPRSETSPTRRDWRMPSNGISSDRDNARRRGRRRRRSVWHRAKIIPTDSRIATGSNGGVRTAGVCRPLLLLTLLLLLPPILPRSSRRRRRWPLTTMTTTTTSTGATTTISGPKAAGGRLAYTVIRMRCMPSVKGRHTSEARIGVHIPTFAYPYIRMHACMHAPPPYSFPPERGTVRVCGVCVCV